MGESINGAELLDRVETYVGRFVAYPSEAARVAHVLWIVHTHRMDAWESTPRIAFLSPEPKSGKTRGLEVSEVVTPRPVHAVNTTPAYLFRKVADEAGPPTILYDEIDTVFGPKAKDNEDIRGLLNAGHRRGAVAGRCVVKGNVVETEELPAYCAVALAGLNDLPDTIMSRSIIIRMRRRSPNEIIEPFRHRVHSKEGFALRDEIAEWSKIIQVDVWPVMPPEITDRDADIWEPLLAVADAAGGAWPERARRHAVALVTDSTVTKGSLGVRLLGDIKRIFDGSGKDHVSTVDLITALVAMDESPWGDLRGKPLDARGLASRLSKYEVKPRTLRNGGSTFKGYDRADLVDVWSRYVTDVTDVTDPTADGHTTPLAEKPINVTDDEGGVLESSKRYTTNPVGINDEALCPFPRVAVTSVTSVTKPTRLTDAELFEGSN
jgi:hypothetical protein